MAPERSDRRSSRPPRPTPAVLRRRRATALALPVLVAVAVLAAVSAGSRPQSGPRGTGGARLSHAAAPAARARARRPLHVDPARVTSYRVASTTLVLSEPAPPAIATGRSAAGAPVRIIPTTIRYPVAADDGQPLPPGGFPLIVFSPGFDISPAAYSGLLGAWARAGFVVAEADYPLTAPSPGGVQESDIVNHPRDLQFVITSVLDAAASGGSPLHGRVDHAAIAVAGHSDGGDVSFAVAANSCCSDARIRAAVILSGAELSAFGGSYDTGRHVPLMVVQGSADTINVPGCSIQLYDQAPASKYYLDILGAEHEPPYLDPGPIQRSVARAVVAFLRASLEGDSSPLAALGRRGALLPSEQLITSDAVPGGQAPTCPGAP